VVCPERFKLLNLITLTFGLLQNSPFLFQDAIDVGIAPTIADEHGIPKATLVDHSNLFKHTPRRSVAGIGCCVDTVEKDILEGKIDK
jgi:hypothetical protein